MLFHLVTGDFPVRGRTLDDLRAAHSAGSRRLLRDARPDLAEAFIAVIDHALASNPVDRYETAGAFESALIQTQAANAQHAAVEKYPTATAKGGASAARKGGVLVVSAIAVVLAILSGAVWMQSRSSSRPVPLKALDHVLVASFENRTGDARLDGSIEAALQHELASSQFINVAGHQRVLDALRLLRQKPDAILTPKLARDVCIRDGAIRAFITGRIERFGAKYTLSAQVVEPGDGGLRASSPW